MDDCLIIGGGVIGLSIAYEMAGQGRRVRLIDRGQPSREASWAGAGMLPPGTLRPQDSPYDQLIGLSHQLHPQWAERLRAETGIDNGYRRCGGIYLARSESAAGLMVTEWHARQIAFEELSPAQVAQLEPELNPSSHQTAYLLPEEGQIRNPRHLQALISACAARGVQIVAGVEAEDFEVRGGCIDRVLTNAGPLQAEQICIATGAWSRGVARRLGIQIAVRPIRGQMALLETDRQVLSRVLNDGHRYLVPRTDGRLLVGSTEEDAGFDCATTASGISGLLRMAVDLVPALSSARFERCWAGLRPSTRDGLPYLGAIPGLSNAYVATGHFRSGLQLSPATGLVMRELMCGQTQQIDLSPFRVDRD